MEKKYPSDLTDAEWEFVQNDLKVDYSKGGRPQKHSKRQFLNAIFYVLRTGCQWRYLPGEYPPWQSVYTQLRRWNQKGCIERVYEKIYTMARRALGKYERATVGIVDSQSVKTTEKGVLRALMRTKKLRGGKGI